MGGSEAVETILIFFVFSLLGGPGAFEISLIIWKLLYGAKQGRRQGYTKAVRRRGCKETSDNVNGVRARKGV